MLAALAGALLVPQRLVVVDDLAALDRRGLLGARRAGEAREDRALAALVADVERVELERAVREVGGDAAELVGIAAAQARGGGRLGQRVQAHGDLRR